jgi:hypothetical protein
VRNTRRIQPADFGPLYHGTSTPGLDVIDQKIGGHRYSGMPGTRGYNYATTSFGEAGNYAHSAGVRDRVESIYEVQPMRQTYGGGSDGKRYRYRWGVDEHSGPSGWYDNYDTKGEALERAEMGNEVSLKFESPLKAREIWSQDRAFDLTEGVGERSHPVPYRFLDGQTRRAASVLGESTGKAAPWDTSISFT